MPGHINITGFADMGQIYGTYVGPFDTISTDSAEVTKLKEQIDKMAKFIDKLDIDEEICEKVQLSICEKYNVGNCTECIKKFFENNL